MGHAIGLFTREFIPAGQMVIEYIGDIVRQKIADRRDWQYENESVGNYQFRLAGERFVDATMKSNYARFMNHSCDPNCYARIITAGGDKKIVIFSKYDIKAFSEITYDYKFQDEEIKVE